jgi:hypothetical protein
LVHGSRSERRDVFWIEIRVEERILVWIGSWEMFLACPDSYRQDSVLFQLYCMVIELILMIKNAEVVSLFEYR